MVKKRENIELSLTKRWMEEEESRSYYTSDDSVCAACFYDGGIKSFVRKHVAEHKCSVGKRTSQKLIAAPADKVLQFILERLHRLYENADGNAPFDSENWEYVVDTWDTSELLYEELENAAPFETLEWIEQHVKGDVTYCRRDWQVMSPGEALTSGWERFSTAVREEHVSCSLRKKRTTARTMFHNLSRRMTRHMLSTRQPRLFRST